MYVTFSGRWGSDRRHGCNFGNRCNDASNSQFDQFSEDLDEDKYASEPADDLDKDELPPVRQKNLEGRGIFSCCLLQVTQGS